MRFVAGELITSIVVVTRLHPHGAVSSSATGEDMVERLPLYRERYAALERGDEV